MFACIYVPDFPVEAIIRAEPLLHERAVAVLDGKPPVVRVIALNEKARSLGMEVGMTKLQAAVFAVNGDEPLLPNPRASDGRKTTSRHIAMPVQQLINKLQNAPAILRHRSAEQERSAHAAMLDVTHAFSPRVEDTASDMLLLDLEGLERLYGPPLKMARELATRVSTVGIEVNIAVAVNPEAAMHAARGFNGVTVISAGQEAQRLAALPIQVLLDAFDIVPKKKSLAPDRERDNLREQMLETLERWGVRDFRTLALLPEHALASRLGGAGALLQRLARGAGNRTLALCDPPMHFEEGMELESPVETLEPLAFLLNRLLEQVCARLGARALAAQELTLRLQLERHVAEEETMTVQELRGIMTPESHNVVHRNLYQHVLRLPVAMRDPKVFLKLLQLELAAHPPGAPIIKLWITAKPARPRSVQQGLFLPITPEAEKLEITLARISSIVGEGRAGIARLLDTHRKDGFHMERFAAVHEEQNESASPASPTMHGSTDSLPLALRIFRPARQLRVQLSDQCPATMTPVRSETEYEHENLQGNILWSAGPWRASGDWWTEQAKGEGANEEPCSWDREEWDVALSHCNDGSVALYRIYRDVKSGQWFVDANYD